jgi:steroid 5-alpha reductase family enzyme
VLGIVQYEKMEALLPGDNHYLAITGIVTIGMQLACFFIAYTCRFDKVTDFAGSSNFIVLVLLSLLGAHNTSPRAIMVTVMVLVCRLELAVYLLYRVLKRGKDDRFDAIRGNFGSFLGKFRFQPFMSPSYLSRIILPREVVNQISSLSLRLLRSPIYRSSSSMIIIIIITGFWIFQMIWAWGVCLPVVFVNSDVAHPPQDGRDWAGLAMFVVGFAIEVIADFQKDRFRADSSNRNRVCDAGVW